MITKQYLKLAGLIVVALIVAHWFSAGQDNIINPEPTVPTTSMETP